MERFRSSIPYKFIASILAILMLGFFLFAPSPAAAQQDYYINFWADQTQIWRGQCVNIHWDTDNVQSVYYEGRGVSGIDQSRIECPTSDTVYNLVVNTRNGQQITRQIYVQVSEPPTNWENWNDTNWNNTMTIDFWADRYQIQAGECVTIYWDTSNVQTVHYEGRGVSGVNQTRVECPNQSTTYDLRVQTRDGEIIYRQIPIQVFGRSFDEGDLTMYPSQLVDFDDDGDVSGAEDDFIWRWSGNGNEDGVIIKVDDDEDLQLAIVGESSYSRFERLSLNECQDRLDDDDEDRLAVEEESIFCLRTDAGDYGKARVEDIRSTDGRIELDWYLWE